VISMDDGPVLREGSKSRKRGAKSAAAANAATLTPGTRNPLNVSRPHRPGLSVAPNLTSMDYRHRPNGLWAPPSDVYRLLTSPIPLSLRLSVLIPRITQLSCNGSKGLGQTVPLEANQPMLRSVAFDRFGTSGDRLDKVLMAADRRGHSNVCSVMNVEFEAGASHIAY